MPNQSGKNGYGDKDYPTDDVLENKLRFYATRNYSRSEKLSRLQVDLGLSIGKSKLNQIERRLGIPTVRRPRVDAEVIETAVIDEIERDTRQGNGPLYVKSKLKDRGIMAARDTVRQIMHEHAPEGFERRFPGKMKPAIERRTLTAIGPYHEISADGHEKLNNQALQMGSISLPIYGYKDKWSDSILKLCVLPDSRSAGSLGHVFLDFIEELGGIPLQITTDKGPEVGWQYAMQDALRYIFAPAIDPEVYPTFVFLKSVHNIVIEAFWHWLREKCGINLKECIVRGKLEHIFHPQVQFHEYLFYWIFVPLIQAELDDFRVYWNQHKVRSQVEKGMPSGHVPDDARQYPWFHGGLDCLVKVPKEAIDELRQHLTEEVGPREKFLSWFVTEFASLADDVYSSLGSPQITLVNAWDVFKRMSDVIDDL